MKIRIEIEVPTPAEIRLEDIYWKPREKTPEEKDAELKHQEERWRIVMEAMERMRKIKP